MLNGQVNTHQCLSSFHPYPSPHYFLTKLPSSRLRHSFARGLLQKYFRGKPSPNVILLEKMRKDKKKEKWSDEVQEKLKLHISRHHTPSYPDYLIRTCTHTAPLDPLALRWSSTHLFRAEQELQEAEEPTVPDPSFGTRLSPLPPAHSVWSR